MRTERWTDPDGHHWPLTGFFCQACRLPMIPTAGYTTHPTCGSSNT